MKVRSYVNSGGLALLWGGMGLGHALSKTGDPFLAFLFGIMCGIYLMETAQTLGESQARKQNEKAD